MTLLEQNTTQSKTYDILEEYDLNWEVSKQKQTYTGTDGREYVSNKNALIRTDTQAQLNTVSDSYYPVQNKFLIDVVYDTFKGIDVDIHRCIPVKEGKRIFIQGEIKGLEQVGNESIKRYITIINSHDGTSSLHIGLGNKVLSCQNQFLYFSRNAGISLRHSLCMEDNLKELPQAIMNTYEDEFKMYDVFRNGNEIPVSNNDIKQVIGKLTDTNMFMDPKEFRELYTSRKVDRVNGLIRAINHETQEKGKNQFGLFNGITYYTNHMMNKNNATERLVVGNAYNLNHKAYEEIFINN